MKSVLTLVATLLSLWIVLFGQAAQAHESRPLYIEISERESGHFELRWRTPPSVQQSNSPEVIIPACEATTPVGVSRGPGGPVSRRLYRCPNNLNGATVEVQFPVLNPSVSALLRVRWLSGETRSVLASPKDSFIAIPTQETTGGVAGEYFFLGVEHIWTGYDHLLFVACLVLISGTLRRLLITVTGFTIAHSITLALAALDLLRVPVAPVEATIALSIVFLATELARNRRKSLTWRYPIAVSASFGLLHGFGFATVLAEIGLPQTEVPAALLSFNVGVEAGQLMFIAAIVVVVLTSRRLSVPWPNWVWRVPVYGTGSLAAFWTIDRTIAFLP